MFKINLMKLTSNFPNVYYIGSVMMCNMKHIAPKGAVA